MEGSHPFAAVDTLWNDIAVHAKGFRKGAFSTAETCGHSPAPSPAVPKTQLVTSNTCCETRRQRGREARGRQDSQHGLGRRLRPTGL